MARKENRMKLKSMVLSAAIVAASLSETGAAEAQQAKQTALKDFGLKEYVYTAKDLPRVETNTWRLVCRLPYNAQFTAWIRYESDATARLSAPIPAIPWPAPSRPNSNSTRFQGSVPGKCQDG